MPGTDICIYFIIAILGLAYPVSLQVVTRLDEKYNSHQIVALFNQNIAWRCFKYLLYLSLGIVLLYILWRLDLKPPCLVNQSCDDWMDHLLIWLTVALLLAFIFYTLAIFTYYIPNDLISFLVRQPDNSDFLIFEVMADLVYYAIRKDDTRVARTAERYIYQRFRAYRDDQATVPLEYPAPFYRMAYQTVLEAITSENSKMDFLGEDAASGRWFLGEFNHTFISELTYSWLWNNLRLIVRHEKDSYVFEYWTNSHQFSSTGLGYIQEQRDGQFQVTNQAAVDQREQERDRFFEFHFALGGMLLHAERYVLLRRIFNHTMSIPPRYELLPVTMSTIFQMFFRFWEPGQPEFYTSRYQLPGLEGIYGEGQAKKWICQYIALLLVRQYSLTSHWYGYEPVSAPELPTRQDLRRLWMDNLKYFLAFVADIRQNQALLQTLGYEHITDEWCAANDKPTPIELIERTLARVTAAFEAEEVEQQAAEEKIQSFYDQSANIVGLRLKAYDNLQNQIPIEGDFNTAKINGVATIQEKSAFAYDQGISHLNYDTFLASILATNITTEITSVFSSTISRSFLFRNKELFQAIDRLELNVEEDVILNWGIDLEVINHFLKIKELDRKQYKGVPIITVEYIDRRIIRSSLLVIKKSNLPQLLYHPQRAEDIQRYSLRQINAAIHLYGTVIDMNEQPQFKELFKEVAPEVADRSVYLRLDIQAELRWPKKIKVIELKLYSEIFQEGVVDQIQEITPFTEPAKNYENT